MQANGEEGSGPHVLKRVPGGECLGILGLRPDWSIWTKRSGGLVRFNETQGVLEGISTRDGSLGRASG